MQIREIKKGEIGKAVDLIWETFLKFEAPDYQKEGVESFRIFIEDDKSLSQLTFFGAYDSDALIGAAAIRPDEGHICLFFVKDSRHRQGVGRALWEHMLKECKCRAFTVNSSPYAVGFYHRLGFADTAKEQLCDGIRFTPMRYERL